MDVKNHKPCPNCGSDAWDSQGINYSSIRMTCGTVIWTNGDIDKSITCITNSIISDLAVIRIIIDDSLQDGDSTKQMAQALEDRLESIRNRCLTTVNAR